MRIEREELEDEGDVALAAALEGDVLAVEQDLPAVGSSSPAIMRKRRGLAAARRPEHDEELAVADGEGRVAARR